MTARFLKSTLFILLVLTCVRLCLACRNENLPRSGYMIIVPENVINAVEVFAGFKEAQGFKVVIVSVEDILASASVNDGPEAIRNYLKAYAREVPQARYVLLVGSPKTVPMRRTSPDPTNHERSLPTDFYYEYLRGDWDADGDGFIGEYGDDLSPLVDDYNADLLVGRIPWDESDQISAICEIIMRYEEQSSARLKRALCAGDSIFSSCDGPLIAKLVKQLILMPAGYATTLLTSESCSRVSPDDVLTMDNFLTRWKETEPGFVTWFAHGNVSGVRFMQASNIPQGVAPTVIASVSCSVADPDTESLARVLMRDGACAAFLGATRDDIFPANPMPLLMSGFRAAIGLLWQHKPLAKAKADFIRIYANAERVPDNISGSSFHQNLFLLIVYGDPSIAL